MWPSQKLQTTMEEVQCKLCREVQEVPRNQDIYEINYL